MTVFKKGNTGYSSVQASNLKRGDTVTQMGRQPYTIDSISQEDGLMKIIDTSGQRHNLSATISVSVSR